MGRNPAWGAEGGSPPGQPEDERCLAGLYVVFPRGREAGCRTAETENSRKKPPLFVTDEWELLKKLRTDPEYKRSALVDSLSVAGIER